METLIVKVNNKKNLSFLKKLLGKFNFVVDVETKPTKRLIYGEEINVAGKLHQYANLEKIKEEETVWQKVAKEKHGPN